MSLLLSTESLKTPISEDWIVSYSPKERLVRSVKVSLFFFIAAFVSVFLPVVHFVLVPLFLSLTVAFGFLKWREVIGVDLSSLSCPRCGGQHGAKEISLSAHQVEARVRCQHCRQTFKVERAD